MPELDEVLSETKAVPVKLGSTTVTVNYRPSVHTRKWIKTRTDRDRKVLDKLRSVQRVGAKIDAGEVAEKEIARLTGVGEEVPEALRETLKKNALTDDEKPLWASMQAGDLFEADEDQTIARNCVELLDPENPWDLVKNGKPVKPTVALLVDTLGHTFTRAILDAIMEDMNPGLREQGPNALTASSA